MRRVIWWSIGAGLVLAGLGALLLRVPAVQDFLIRRLVTRLVALRVAELARRDTRA